MERLIISRPDLAGRCSSSFTVLSRALLKAGAFMRAPIVIAAMWLTTPAEAADIYTTQLLGTTIIHIDGVIQFSDEKKFAPLARARGVPISREASARPPAAVFQ